MSVRLSFATPALDGAHPFEPLLLTRSLRRWGGGLAEAPVRVMAPAGAPPGAVASALAAAGAERGHYAVPEALAGLPYADLVCAAAAAEECAEGSCDLLAWMCPDALVLREPEALLLPPGTRLGCRPVHHRLIGSLWEERPDRFWSLLYERCGVGEERLFAMETCAEHEPIRPYVNAGMLVVQPEDGLLRAWRDELLRLTPDVAFAPFLQRSRLHAVFFHQTVLAGALLARLTPAEIHLLPPTVNYPLHLHQTVAPERRPTALDDLITARYDDIRDRPWRTALPASEALGGWLAGQLAEADAQPREP